jgi:molybdopterin-containing oxidoreductase family membrane subunit
MRAAAPPAERQWHPSADTRISADLLAFVLRTPRWFWVAAGLLAALAGAGAAAEGLMVLRGLQLLGLTNTVQWAVLIANFVFWVGISHAGVMISAILRLAQAEWRRPISRAAEVLALFALLTAGLFPLIHTGRVWRTAYWIAPYDFTRNIWPNPRSALIWDPSAILTYLSGTVLFIYTGLIPDLASARDHSAGWRRRLYGFLAMGFRGTARQWRVQKAAGPLMAALILAVFVSVHSIVAWDFAVTVLPGWHTTVLAPFFVAGAVHSGVAGVVIAMVALRRVLRAQAYITAEHLDVIGRLQVVVGLVYLFFFLLDFYFSLFSRGELERRIWELRLFAPPTNVLFYTQVLATLVVPLPLLAWRRLRRSAPAMLALALLINAGMWLERYLFVVTPLSLKQPFVFTWVTTYEPRPIEYVFTAAAFGLVALGVLLFAKLLPIIPLWEIREGRLLEQEVRTVRLREPAAP